MNAVSNHSEYVSSMNVRGIVVYLAIAFGLAFGLEWLILSQEWVNYDNRSETGLPVFWGLYFIPGIAALVASARARGDESGKGAAVV